MNDDKKRKAMGIKNKDIVNAFSLKSVIEELKQIYKNNGLKHNLYGQNNMIKE